MSFDKPKHSLPKMEDVESGDVFAFNFAPTDKYQFFDENSVRRPHEFKKAIQLLFKKNIYPYAKYKCNIEVSPMGRLHIHGKITINDPLGFYLDIHRLMNAGTVVIKFLQDDGWDDYCIKQKNHWLPFDPVITSEDKVATNREILLSALDD